MIKFIETHLKKKRVLARAAQPKEVLYVSREDIQRKLTGYTPVENTKKANFTGPLLNKQEFEGAV